MSRFSGFACVRFSALGGRYEKFITLCSQNGIPLCRLRPEPGGISAAVPVRYYRKTAKLAKSCRVKLRVQKRSGVYFQLRRFRGRWGLVLAPVVFLITTAWMGRMVWSVRWLGVEAAQQPVVRKALYSMDICEGAVLTQQKVRDSEKQLLTQLPELGWLSLNFGKGRLVIEAAPFRPQPEIEPNDPIDLVSKADGTILEMTVEEGIQMKKPGQTVAQGEVVIRAGREDRDGQMITAHAKGTVLAQVSKTYQARQPVRYTAEVPTGKLQSSRVLLVAGRKLPLGKNSKEVPAGAQSFFQPVEVWGFSLPATLEERLWTEKITRTAELDEQAAQERARLACRSQLYREFPGARILNEEENMAFEEGDWVCTLTITFAADISEKAM